MGRPCAYCDKEERFYSTLRHEKICKAKFLAEQAAARQRIRIAMEAEQRRAAEREHERRVEALDRKRKQAEKKAIEAALARHKIEGEKEAAEAAAALAAYEAKWSDEGSSFPKTKFEEAEEEAALLKAAKARAQCEEDYAAFYSSEEDYAPSDDSSSATVSTIVGSPSMQTCRDF